MKTIIIVVSTILCLYLFINFRARTGLCIELAISVREKWLLLNECEWNVKKRLNEHYLFDQSVQLDFSVILVPVVSNHINVAIYIGSALH